TAARRSTRAVAPALRSSAGSGPAGRACPAGSPAARYRSAPTARRRGSDSPMPRCRAAAAETAHPARGPACRKPGSNLKGSADSAHQELSVVTTPPLEKSSSDNPTKTEFFTAETQRSQRSKDENEGMKDGG